MNKQIHKYFIVLSRKGADYEATQQRQQQQQQQQQQQNTFYIKHMKSNILCEKGVNKPQETNLVSRQRGRVEP